jgi:hypothetical protein
MGKTIRNNAKSGSRAKFANGEFHIFSMSITYFTLFKTVAHWQCDFSPFLIAGFLSILFSAENRNKNFNTRHQERARKYGNDLYLDQEATMSRPAAPTPVRLASPPRSPAVNRRKVCARPASASPVVVAGFHVSNPFDILEGATESGSPEKSPAKRVSTPKIKCNSPVRSLITSLDTDIDISKQAEIASPVASAAIIAVQEPQESLLIKAVRLVGNVVATAAAVAVTAFKVFRGWFKMI